MQKLTLITEANTLFKSEIPKDTYSKVIKKNLKELKEDSIEMERIFWEKNTTN